MPKGTYSLIGRTMPRFREGMRKLPTSTMNASLEALERSGSLTGNGCGIALEQLPNGVNVKALPPTVAKVALVTTTVSKMVGATPGMGEATLQAFINGVLVSTGQTAKVYSILTDKQVDSGAYVQVKRIDGQWFVDTVDACTHLSASAGPPPFPPVVPSAAPAASVLNPAGGDAPGSGGGQPRFTFAFGSPVQGD